MSYWLLHQHEISKTFSSAVSFSILPGSGCGHDADFIWTSTGPATPRPAVEAPVPVPDDFHLFLACGAGENGCGGEAIGVSLPTERHEVRCCSNYPLNGWKKGGGQCTNYHESDLTALDGTPNQCFHSSTYAEAQEICYANNAQVCTATEVLDQCARGEFLSFVDLQCLDSFLNSSVTITLLFTRLWVRTRWRLSLDKDRGYCRSRCCLQDQEDTSSSYLWCVCGSQGKNFWRPSLQYFRQLPI